VVTGVDANSVPSGDLAGLFDLATASDARSLHRLAAAAEQSVLGCSAANVATWRAAEPQLIASTHPDLPGLIEVEVQAGRGPVLAALASAGAPVSCPDTLTEPRWPEYAQAALIAGVRCSLTFAHLAGADAVSLTLFGARPQAIDPRQAQSTQTLGALGGAVLGAMSVYQDARRTASQLQDAADGRAVMDQAKGILMHALHCSADEALRHLRETSQRKNVRALDVAREIVASVT
jgi:hypothetical protein